MPVIEALGVEHAYRRFPGVRVPSLRGVDLTVEPGEAWGLVGPNGSGKSTLLRALAGLVPTLAGDVRVAGHPAGARTARRAIGYVPESVRWPSRLTVEGVLVELASLAGAGDADRRVDDALGLLGLRPLRRRRLGTLSFGQARRVAVAQGLMDDAPVLLLDEPFSGLDSLVIHDVVVALRERLARGRSLVLASHRLDDVAALCTHVLALRDGRTVRSGPADEVLERSAEREGLAELLGAPA